MTILKYPVFLLCLFLGMACQQQSSVDVKTLSAKTTSGINVVIEIPAGTNHKIEFNKTTGAFENDLVDGKTRVIDFLPYPGNYGFIPATMMDKEQGGDGDALDVLVIGETVPTGTVMVVKPIAALQLLDGGEVDTKIIAIPADSTLRVMNVDNFETFFLEYNMALTIIKDWFLNYKGLGKMELVGWKDEKYALKEIEKWSVKLKE